MAVAVAAIVSFFVFGFPPIDGGTEGTIGAANRYQGSQISMKDVKVPNSAVQTFIQGDVFDRLMKDSKTRAALVTMRLTLARDGETVTLMHQVHVENSP